MKHVTFAGDNAALSDLLDRVEAGETVEITRQGRTVARLIPATPEKLRFDVDALRVAAKTIPFQHESAGNLVRRMRDDGY